LFLTDSRMSKRTTEWWIFNRRVEISHPPCSPDFAPNASFVFLEVRMAVTGTKPLVVEHFKLKMTTVLKADLIDS